MNKKHYNSPDCEEVLALEQQVISASPTNVGSTIEPYTEEILKW